MNFCADVTKVCKFLGIKSEAFNALTVAEIEQAKWGIQVQELEERRNDEVLMERYRHFFKAYDTFVLYFGKELTDKYLPIIPLEELIDTEYVRAGTPTHKANARLIGKGDWYFPIRRGRGSRSGIKEHAPADIYEVSSDYQGLQHSEIVLAIFDEIYPWLQEFEVSVYELRNGEGIHEFYVETESEHSLYVPYKCLVNGDTEGILNRNKDYLGWYSRFGKKSNPSYEDLIQTPTVKRFLQLVKENHK